jgi:hypothetical protein
MGASLSELVLEDHGHYDWNTSSNKNTKYIFSMANPHIHFTGNPLKNLNGNQIKKLEKVFTKTLDKIDDYKENVNYSDDEKDPAYTYTFQLAVDTYMQSFEEILTEDSLGLSIMFTVHYKSSKHVIDNLSLIEEFIFTSIYDDIAGIVYEFGKSLAEEIKGASHREFINIMFDDDTIKPAMSLRDLEKQKKMQYGSVLVTKGRYKGRIMYYDDEAYETDGAVLWVDNGTLILPFSHIEPVLSSEKHLEFANVLNNISLMDIGTNTLSEDKKVPMDEE